MNKIKIKNLLEEIDNLKSIVTAIDQNDIKHADNGVKKIDKINTCQPDIKLKDNKNLISLNFDKKLGARRIHSNNTLNKIVNKYKIDLLNFSSDVNRSPIKLSNGNMKNIETLDFEKKICELEKEHEKVILVKLVSY